MTAPARWYARLGPGLLFAGAAIGTSHLVQSTRAGALYGLGLLGIIVFANLLKYPTFRFGPAYAAATGRSLIEGYRRLGRLPVLLIALSQYAVQVVILAAVAITTAGLAAATLGLTVPPPQLAAALLAAAFVLLTTGGFRLLERLTRVFIAVLTLATVVATLLVLPDVDWHPSNFVPPAPSPTLLFFLIALFGLMPAAPDLSILHSLWSVARARTQGAPIDHDDAVLDFDIGYFGSAALALCFVIMGAGLMHPLGTEPDPTPVGFASQVIALYDASLGQGAALVVGIAAFGVLFTTLIAILDGFPRVHAATWYALHSDDGRVDVALDGSRPLRIVAVSQLLLAVGILLWLMGNFLAFIDVVNVTAFIVAPLIAWLNHVVITGDDVPAALRPGRVLRLWSGAAIVTLGALSLAYFYFRFGAAP